MKNWWKLAAGLVLAGTVLWAASRTATIRVDWETGEQEQEGAAAVPGGGEGRGEDGGGRERVVLGVGQEGVQPLADEVRRGAEAARAAVEAIAGGTEQAEYQRAAALLAAGEAAYAVQDYGGAAAQWVEAEKAWSAAREAAVRALNEAAERAVWMAQEARVGAAGTAGGRDQAAYRDGERLLGEGREAYGRGDADGARKAWTLAAEQFESAEAAARAAKESAEAARAAAAGALEEARQAKAAAERVKGAATQAEYVEAEGALAEGETLFQKEYFEDAKATGERAAGKYRAAAEVAATKKRQAKKQAALLQAARAAEESEWWEEVQRKAEEVLQTDPDHPEALSLRETAVSQLRAAAAPEKPDSERAAGTLRTVKLPNGDEMVLAWCPPGAVGAGGERLPGFWLGQTEVTQGQWESLMGGKVRQDKKRGVAVPDEANWPVRGVSWAECVEFCEALNEKAKQERGVWRLPREAEWAWADQAGGAGGGREFAWFRDNSGGQPHRVKEGMANAWGLYDMRGNVEEWCSDRYGEEGVSREMHVIRGGSYASEGEERRWGPEGTPEEAAGFRLCLEE